MEMVSRRQYLECREVIKGQVLVETVSKDFCHSYACCNTDLDRLQGLYQMAWQELRGYQDGCRVVRTVPRWEVEKPLKQVIAQCTTAFHQRREWHRGCPDRREADADWRHLKEAGVAKDGSARGDTEWMRILEYMI